MSISDRWHKAHPGPDDLPCKEHRRGNTRLYPTREHLRGDRWLVRWREDNGEQGKRSFPKRNGKDPETCAEAFDAQRTADEARGDWIDPRVGKTPFAEYASAWMKSRLHKTGITDTYELHLRNHIVPAFGRYGHLVPEASARARDALDGAFAEAHARAKARAATGAPPQGMCPESAPDAA